MVNISEIISIMRVNGFNENTPIETVSEILSRIHYNDTDKQEALNLLRTQGWFKQDTGTQTIPTLENTAQETAKYATPTPISVSTPAEYPTTKGLNKKLLAILILFLIVLIGGGSAFAYIQKIGPFSVSTYDENNFFSGLLVKIAEIDSATYTASGALSVVPRENDAKPFTTKISNIDELNKKYYYDSQRLKDAVSIINTLNYSAGYSKYYYNKNTNPKAFPASIKTLASQNQNNYYDDSNSVTDPFTNKDYEYKTTEGGKNFLLTVEFETDQAIKTIKGYGYVSTTTIISGKKVSFTRDSSSYVYMPSEPPKPYLVEMGEAMRMLPADIDVLGSISVSSDNKSGSVSNWLVNLNGEGDFGDMTYKINIDAIKKDDTYYVKINNIPSLFSFFGDFGSMKGKWVSISPKAKKPDTNNSYSPLSYIEESMAEVEKEYKDNKAKTVKVIKKMVEIADEVKLISFVKKPVQEKVDGRELTKYQLSIKQDAILPFYRKMQDEMNNNPEFSEYKSVVDEGLVEYLQSEEFNEVFDYINKNNTFILWTDSSGFPAIVQNTMRIVPPDTATQLENKQINVVFKIIIDDINKSMDIKAPTESVTLEKLTEDINKNMNYSGNSKLAAIKANLSNIRASAEIAYDSTQNSYGKKPFSLGPCKKTSDTLFADSYISKSLDAATDNDVSLATCVSKGTTGKVTSYAVSIPLPDKNGFSWCVDSRGASKEIIGVIKSDICK